MGTTTGGRLHSPRALISVYDKTGVVEFARTLALGLGWDIISTGGTARVLREANLQVTDVSEVTGYPEMMDGRVKTLHPAVHAGLLALRHNPKHMAALEEHKIIPIDLVAVNLCPFRETAETPGISSEAVIEQIDIGGPSMLRSAAKNAESVTVIVDPIDYGEVIDQIRSRKNGPGEMMFRKYLAGKVFRHTSEYDGAIADWHEEQVSKQ